MDTIMTLTSTPEITPKAATPIAIPISQVLQTRGMRPTPQRLAVYAYLHDKKAHHPTVDMVYKALAPEYPTLSKTTVYQTLETLYECGLVHKVPEEGEMRFDAELSKHGHFKCTKCNGIFDIFFSDTGCLPQPQEGFMVKETHLYHKGLCPKCHKT